MLAPKIPMRKYLSSARMGRRITSQRRLTVQIDRRQPRANNFVLIRCGQLSSQLTPQCSGVPSTSACGSNLADLLSYKKSGSIQSQSWLVEPMTVLSSQHDATSNSLSTNPSWFFNSDLLNSRCLVVFHPTITPTLFVTHSNERPKLNDGVKMSQKEVTNRSPSEPVGKFPEGKPNWTQLEHIVNRLTLTVSTKLQKQRSNFVSLNIKLMNISAALLFFSKTRLFVLPG